MAIYYVDQTGGDDSKDGLAQTISGGAGPWKTIAKVNASSFSAGDSILFKKGEVWREKLTVPSAGAAGNPIIIGAYGSGADPLILGSTAITTWAANVITPVLGDVLSEDFVGSNAFTGAGTGTNDLVWAGTETTGSTINSDNTDIADPLGGSTHLLKVVKGSSGFEAWCRTSLAADNPITYTKFYVYVSAEGLANTNKFTVVAARDSTGKGTFTIYLYKNGSGVLQWTGGYYTNGAATDFGVSPTATLSVWTMHEVKYDSTNSTYEWRIDGISVASGSLTGTKSAGIKDFRCGSFAVEATANTYYIDSIEISSATYPVAGTGNTWKASYAPMPDAVWAVVSGTPHWGVKKANDVGCTDLYDWFSDGADLYINSGGVDPDTWDSVEVSVRDICVFAQSKANLTIQDIHVRFTATNGAGIFLYRLCHNAIVQRCTADYNFNNGISGITGSAEAPNDVLVTNCVAAYNGLSGIALSDYGRRWTVSHNTVHHNGADYTQSFPAGIKLYGPNGSGGHIIEFNDVYLNGNALYTIGAAGAIWIDRLDETPASPAHIPAIIRYNKTYNNLMNGIFHEKVSRSEVYYNLIYGNVNGVSTDTAGYRLDAFLTHSASANHVFNNLIYGNYIGMKIQSDSSAAGQIIDNLFKNNIAYGNTLYQLAATAGGNNDGTYGSGNVYANNLFGAEAASFIEWAAGVFKDTIAAFNAVADDTAGGGSNITGDPLFANAALANFILLAGSPAINAGQDVGLVVDYLNNAVPSGANPDIGAYEYATASYIASPVFF